MVLTGEEIEPRRAACLLGDLNSFALDFVARQKVGGVHLNFFIVNQLPIFPPEFYEERCPWHKRQTLQKWISDRVLKLTCTADDMRPLAEAAGLDPPVHRWNPRQCAELMAELDAAFFLLYGIGRDDVEYVLSTFQGLCGKRTRVRDCSPPTAESWKRTIVWRAGRERPVVAWSPDHLVAPVTAAS